jgi:hypothetical protein
VEARSGTSLDGDTRNIGQSCISGADSIHPIGCHAASLDRTATGVQFSRCLAVACKYISSMCEITDGVVSLLSIVRWSGRAICLCTPQAAGMVACLAGTKHTQCPGQALQMCQTDCQIKQKHAVWRTCSGRSYSVSALHQVHHSAGDRPVRAPEVHFVRLRVCARYSADGQAPCMDKRRVKHPQQGANIQCEQSALA